MSVIVLLICVGGMVAGGFLCAFLWAVEAGQFDDTYTPALRVLLDDDDGSVSPSGSEGAVHDQSRS